MELAQKVVEAIGKGKDFRPLYGNELTIKQKIERIGYEIYGASMVNYLPAAEKVISSLEAAGYGGLPVCIAKTQASISDNPSRKGAPTGWKLTVRDVYVSAGAGFIVPICGQMTLMPGLPKNPAAERIDLDAEGVIRGLR